MLRYVGCSDRILAYSPIGTSLIAYECVGITSLSTDWTSDSVYATCTDGVNRIVKISPASGDQTFTSFCSLPRAIAGNSHSFFLRHTHMQHAHGVHAHKR